MATIADRAVTPSTRRLVPVLVVLSDASGVCQQKAAKKAGICSANEKDLREIRRCVRDRDGTAG
jgi:hypothetical protein